MRYRVPVCVAVALLAAGCGSSKSGSSNGTTTSVASAASAASGATVNIDLSDKQGTNGPMTMTLSAPSAKSGKVTFVVKNSGTVDHEMVALKTDTAVDKLEVDSEGKVSEDASVGETGDPELKPGESRTVTLDMAAGSYVLVCNVAKHYGLGMRAAFTAGS